MTTKPANLTFLFRPQGGHSFYRAPDGGIWLTDNSGAEFFQVDTAKPIAVGRLRESGSAVFTLALREGGCTVVDNATVTALVDGKVFAVKLRVGGVVFTPTELEPLPVVRPGLGFTDADAARFAARAEGYARQYLGGGGAFPASIPAIKARLASCALPPRDEWMGEIGAAIARLAPEYEADARDEALRGRIAFEVTVRDVLPVPTKGKRQLIAECAVRIPHAGADYRTGRAIVYQLAAKVEALAPRETWAMDVDVELAPGGAAAETGLRGHVRIWATDGGVPHGFARQHLHTAAAAVLPEIRTVI